VLATFRAKPNRFNRSNLMVIYRQRPPEKEALAPAACHPWFPVGSSVGPRFFASISGSPQKIRTRWLCEVYRCLSRASASECVHLWRSREDLCAHACDRGIREGNEL